jgi:hypothetical protein
MLLLEKDLIHIPEKKIELSKASFLQLGNALLSTYTEFIRDDAAKFSTPVSIVVSIETEELIMALEKIENLQDSFDFDIDQELFSQDDKEDGARKKRKESAQFEQRHSKRVKKEKEIVKLSPESLIRDNLDPLLPQGWKLTCGDNKNMSFLVKDLQEFFESMASRLAVNNSLSIQKSRIKRYYLILTISKLNVLKLNEYIEIAEEIAQTHSVDNFNLFLESVPHKASILDVMRLYIIHILVHETCLSSDMSDMISLMLKRIEMHNCGTNTFQYLPQLKNNKKLLKVLLPLCEIVFDGISESDINMVVYIS